MSSNNDKTLVQQPFDLLDIRLTRRRQKTSTAVFSVNMFRPT